MQITQEIRRECDIESLKSFSMLKWDQVEDNDNTLDSEGKRRCRRLVGKLM